MLFWLLHTAAIQWFGVDIGGTLVKAVYYETSLEGEEEGDREREREGASSSGAWGHKHEGINALKNFIKSSLTYGSTGMRDQRLEMNNVRIADQEGTLHFIKFATGRMEGFFDMVTKNGLSRFPKIICATGGGAFKFEKDFKKVSLLEYRLCILLTLISHSLSPSPPLSTSTLVSLYESLMRCSA